MKATIKASLFDSKNIRALCFAFPSSVQSQLLGKIPIKARSRQHLKQWKFKAKSILSGGITAISGCVCGNEESKIEEAIVVYQLCCTIHFCTDCRDTGVDGTNADFDFEFIVPTNRIIEKMICRLITNENDRQLSLME